MHALASGPPVVVTVVHAPACHFCDGAQAALDELASEVPLVVRVVELKSGEGAALVAQHLPAMYPLVLLDGVYFSSGRLPRKKLRAELERRGPLAPSIPIGHLLGALGGR